MQQEDCYHEPNNIVDQSPSNQSPSSLAVPVNSAATISSQAATNRTYLQCYSREANKNLISWADQMSTALRDSVAHLDQICMRVRSCLSDLEANEIRYLHMQRRPSIMEQYQPAAISRSLQPVELYAMTRDCYKHDEVDCKQVEESHIAEPVAQSEPPIEIESLPPGTPVIVEPLVIQNTAGLPRMDMQMRPKSRRGDNSSREFCSRPKIQDSLVEKQKTSKSHSCRKIATVQSLKPVMSVREHLELTKDANISSRQVYKNIFRNKLIPLQNSSHPIMRLPTPPHCTSRPKSILKVQNKLTTKSMDSNIKLPSATASTIENTIRNKENYKFNDSLWFKNKPSHSKMHDHCGCKVVVESPRIPTLQMTTSRATYNAQSRLQWIRAKNSLVLEYGKTQAAAAADNQRQSMDDGTTPAAKHVPPPPIDLLDAINYELVRPLQSEYPRKDGDTAVGEERKGDGAKQDWADEGDEGGNELLIELLQDPSRLKGLVQSTSRRTLSHQSAHNYNHPLHRHNLCPTPVIKIHSQRFNDCHLPQFTMYQKKKQATQQNKQRGKKQQSQQRSEVRVLKGAVEGDAGDLVLGRTVCKRGKEATRRNSERRCGSNSRGEREDKENVVPIGGMRGTENSFSSWSNMSPHEIKTKLLPFLIPDERTYTVLPITEIVYDRKPPIPPELPATTITKESSSAHLNNSTTPSNCKVFKRSKPRSLYTDVKTQRKLDTYLELRDINAYNKPCYPTVYTTLPAVTITNPYTFNSSHRPTRQSAHQHHQHYHPRRHQSNPRSTNAPQHCDIVRCNGNSDSGGGAVMSMEDGLLLDKAKKAKATISAATRRDIGSSIQKLEDKIAELISDPSKIGDGKAFDDVEQDIVRMLNKITPSQDKGDTSVETVAATTDNIGACQISSSTNTEESPQVHITMESAINLMESTQMTNIAEIMKKTSEETNREVYISTKSSDVCAIRQPKKFTTVPCDAMDITAGLKEVAQILDPNQQNFTTTELTSPRKSSKKERLLQPIYENIASININNHQDTSISKDIISQISTPRKVFKIENIPEFVSEGTLSQISDDFNFGITVKNQKRDDSSDRKMSASEPELKRIKKLDGTSGKPKQELIVSTDNLCSIESDQFVTPFMKVVRKYRQEDTHDNFMQFLEALTQLSQDNTMLCTDSTKLEKNKDFSVQDLSNPLFNPKEAQFINLSKDAGEQPNPVSPQQLQSSTIEVMYVNRQTDITLTNQKKQSNCYLKKPTVVLKKTDNICSQFMTYIRTNCKNYADERFMLEYKSQSNDLRSQTVTSRGLVLKFAYTVLFVVVFVALKWNGNCIR